MRQPTIAPPPEMLELSVVALDDRRRLVRVSGELDLATAPFVERAVAEARGAGLAVVLDLARVRFADCRGLRTVVESCTPESPSVQVLAVSPAIERLVDLIAPLREPCAGVLASRSRRSSRRRLRGASLEYAALSHGRPVVASATSS